MKSFIQKSLYNVLALASTNFAHSQSVSFFNGRNGAKTVWCFWAATFKGTGQWMAVLLVLELAYLMLYWRQRRFFWRFSLSHRFLVRPAICG